MKNSEILTINTGSSSLKAALFSGADGLTRTVSVDVKGIGSETSQIATTTVAGGRHASTVHIADQAAALAQAFLALADHSDLTAFSIVGHRVVHGGPDLVEPQLVDEGVIRVLRGLVSLAPDHLPQAIESIEYVAKQYPMVQQMACFDTAFHQMMPWVAKSYALPPDYFDAGIRRYGFHGLSYAFVMQALATLEPSHANGRVIVAHLGSGASMAAIRQGKSIDTSMGFTPESGLVMSTRPGTLDAGAVLRILNTMGLDANQLDAFINHEAGLLGVSGVSGDMQALLLLGDRNPRAAAAVALFCYRAKTYLGAYCAALGGLDLLVFTGGIGENAPDIRRRICEEQQFLGIELDEALNRANAPVISGPSSRVCVRVISTDEDLMIAQHARQFIGC